MPDVALDRSSPVPLYYQVATRLQQLIESGDLPVGSKLPNEVDLAEKLGVSRPTMRHAINYLVERGMLVRKRGVGTQIVHPKVRRPLASHAVLDIVNSGAPRGSPSRRASAAVAARAPTTWLAIRGMCPAARSSS